MTCYFCYKPLHKQRHALKENIVHIKCFLELKDELRRMHREIRDARRQKITFVE
jgi:hypothetical protein